MSYQTTELALIINLTISGLPNQLISHAGRFLGQQSQRNAIVSRAPSDEIGWIFFPTTLGKLFIE